MGYTFLDGRVIRAHQHAVRARSGKLDPNSTLSSMEQVLQREALGGSKGGFSTEIYWRCDGNGLPITFWVTVGERHETDVFEQLMWSRDLSSVKAVEDLACDLIESVEIRAIAVAKSD